MQRGERKQRAPYFFTRWKSHDTVVSSSSCLPSGLNILTHAFKRYLAILWRRITTLLITSSSTICFLPTVQSRSPQSYPIRDAQSVEFYVKYHILWENVVVFILDVKSGPRLPSVGVRQEADDQIRRRLLELTDLCPLPKLRAVCAFGTQLCFYEAEAVQGPALHELEMSILIYLLTRRPVNDGTVM